MGNHIQQQRTATTVTKKQLSFKLRNVDSVRNRNFGTLLILRINNLTKQNLKTFFSILFQKMLFSIISIELQSEKNTIITGTLSQILLFSLPPLNSCAVNSHRSYLHASSYFYLDILLLLSQSYILYVKYSTFSLQCVAGANLNLRIWLK